MAQCLLPDRCTIRATRAIRSRSSPSLYSRANCRGLREGETIEGKEALVGLERYIILRSIDRRWQDHLTEMEELRRSVNLRGYGQKDPLSEYKSEAFGFFEELMGNVRTEICNGGLSIGNLCSGI